jgi:hypothetical protein
MGGRVPGDPAVECRANAEARVELETAIALNRDAAHQPDLLGRAQCVGTSAGIDNVDRQSRPFPSFAQTGRGFTRGLATMLAGTY